MKPEISTPLCLPARFRNEGAKQTSPHSCSLSMIVSQQRKMKLHTKKTPGSHSFLRKRGLFDRFQKRMHIVPICKRKQPTENEAGATPRFRQLCFTSIYRFRSRNLRHKPRVIRSTINSSHKPFEQQKF